MLERLTWNDIRNLVFRLCMMAYMFLFVEYLSRESGFSHTFINFSVKAILIFIGSICLNVSIKFELSDISETIMEMMRFFSNVRKYRHCGYFRLHKYVYRKDVIFCIETIKKMPATLYNNMTDNLIALCHTDFIALAKQKIWHIYSRIFK